MGYRGVWWRLFNAPNTSEWTNCLILARLLFTLPLSNGKLERIFSTLKVIKVDRRSLLGNETLDDLLLLNSDLVALTDFNPDQSIKLGGMLRTDDQTRIQGESTGRGQPLPVVTLMRRAVWTLWTHKV